MNQKKNLFLGLLGIMIVFLSTGCSNDKNPIAPFEPEVINNADAFQFQITDAKNVTTTLTYPWSNTGAQATIDHSTALTSGIASVTIFDADSSQVYTSGLLASANESSTSGTIGTWYVKVTFNNFSGTVNFRVEKL